MFRSTKVTRDKCAELGRDRCLSLPSRCAFSREHDACFAKDDTDPCTKRAGSDEKNCTAKPRNPRHSDTIEGGRNRVSENLRSATTVSGSDDTIQTLFGVKALFDPV